MATVREIIDYAKRKFPSDETDANCVIDLNDIQAEIYLAIKKSSNIYTTVVIESVAAQEDYDLPANCKIEDIIKLEVADIDGEFSFIGFKDDTDFGNFYLRSTTATKFKLLIDDAAITTTGTDITVSYYARPIALLSTTPGLAASPLLDSDYHALYKYALVNRLASQGNNPDTEIADFYQKKYDELLGDVFRDMSDKFNNAPTRRPEAKERM